MSIRDGVLDKVVNLAIDDLDLSPLELTVLTTDTENCSVSEVLAYSIFESHDLITSPAFIVAKALTRPNFLNQVN